MPHIQRLSYYENGFPWHQNPSAGPYVNLATVQPGLGFYRPNQAFYRGIVPGVSRTLGQESIPLPSPSQLNLTDPGTLLMLAGAGFLVWYLFQGGRAAARKVSKFRSGRNGGGRRRRSHKTRTPYGTYDLDELYPT